MTAFGQVALRPADLVRPAGMPAALAAEVDAQLAPLRDRHRVVDVGTDGLVEALRALDAALAPAGAAMATMGRPLDVDRWYFLAAAAAGRHAARLAGAA